MHKIPVIKHFDNVKDEKQKQEWEGNSTVIRGCYEGI